MANPSCSSGAVDSNGWKKGPLPDGTFDWGGVVPFDHKGSGFEYADFWGHYIIIPAHNGRPERKLLPHEVKLYNNSLKLPPTETKTE